MAGSYTCVLLSASASRLTAGAKTWSNKRAFMRHNSLCHWACSVQLRLQQGLVDSIKTSKRLGESTKGPSNAPWPGRGAFCLSGAVTGTVELRYSFSQAKTSTVIFLYNWICAWFPLRFIKEAEIILKPSPKYLSKGEALIFFPHFLCICKWSGK